MPGYTLLQFCLDIHSLNENDIKNDDQCIFFDLCPKLFSGRVNPFEFEGGEINYTKTVREIVFLLKEKNKRRDFNFAYKKENGLL